MAPQTPITTTKRRKTAAGGKGWEKAKWVPKIEEEDGDENQPSLARDSMLDFQLTTIPTIDNINYDF
jgi:hypothetical protein